MPGALVISIDFELHWGVLERSLDGPYRRNLEGVPQSILQTLALFRDFEVSATWATVGLLFARSRAEQIAYAPTIRPRYASDGLDPYRVTAGENERADPFHYAPTLIGAIARTPRQELGTHTFGHFYCLTEGGNQSAAFAADLESAARIMRDTVGVTPRSIVFPRNQHNPALDPVLLASGIRSYRGSPNRWMWRARERETALSRAGRLVDAYVRIGADSTTAWDELVEPSGLVNIPASFLVRPLTTGMRRRRICQAMRRASAEGRIIHLWWHPHNFGVNIRENMNALRALLECFSECRQRDGMESLSMAEAAERVAPVEALRLCGD